MEIDGIEMNEFDEIEFSFRGKRYRGIVMPSPEGSLIVKLPSGYNISLPSSMLGAVRVVGKADAGKKEGISSSGKRGTGEGIGFVLTGGTIASKVDYRTGGVHGLSSMEELLEMVPELERFGTIEWESPFVKMSEDMEIRDYPEMARSIYRLLKRHRGVVVLHGTDTMHFSSAMMSFMLRTGKPVVFTGSQRSTDRPSTDGWMNMICSAVTATYDIAGVGICMHATTSDDYCHFIPGTKARKMHTSRRDAFRPVNAKPWLRVWPNGYVEEVGEFRRRSDELSIDAKASDKVAMVEAYPSSDPSILDFHAEHGAKGIIVKATALGHVPTFSSRSWVEKIRDISGDVFVGIVSQTLYGSTHPYVYTNLRLLSRAGGVFLGDMLPETAYAKLSWAAAHADSPEEIGRIMLTNIAGEMSLREEWDEFLL